MDTLQKPDTPVDLKLMEPSSTIPEACTGRHASTRRRYPRRISSRQPHTTFSRWPSRPAFRLQAGKTISPMA
jgi:hypothetical protein